MSIEVRSYAASDEEAYFSILSATYNNGAPVPPDKRSTTGKKVFVSAQDGVVAGVARLLDFVTARGSADLATAGVAAVAVAPTHRQSGVGTALLSWLVRQVREEGVPVTTLYAFRESFYRKMGYEVAGKRISITVPSYRLPKVRSSLPIQKLDAAEWQKIAPCYEAYIRSRSGFVVRSPGAWEGQRWGMEHPAIYAFGDPVEAYAVVGHKVDFWESQKVTEVVWSTEAGHRAIVAWLAGLGANKTHLSWYEASDSPYLSRYFDQGVEVKIERPMMYRIADVPKALALLKPESSGEFCIRVGDDLIEENCGPWRVSFGPGGVEVQKCDSADLELDIRMFAPAFFGEPGIVDLARNGLVTVRDARALQAASALLPAAPVGCLDFF